MERRGGCCIARYGGGADVAWRVGRIMLKYRPIAPKPTAMAPVPATVDPKPVTSSGRNKRKATGTSTGTRKRGRKPRKQIKVSTGTTEEREEKCSSSSSNSSGTTSVDSSSLVTLPLMPETPDEKKGAPLSPVSVQNQAPSVPVLVPRPVRPVGSCVALEGLSSIWKDREVPAMPNLLCDEAPAFVSDTWGRVTWTNEAYRSMVTAGELGEKEEVRVGLVTRGLVPVWGTCHGYTCRVRVRYVCKKKGRVSLAAPCDVWRVEGGGYAWRLDVKAALSLTLSLS